MTMQKTKNPAGGRGIIKEIVEQYREWMQYFATCPACQDMIVAAILAGGLYV